jgi:tetratricopeptide (TPR) repeat protein
LEIREKVFGINHPDVGKQLNNLALLCLNQSKYDKVEEYYQRAIHIYTKSYGRSDPNVLKTKNNLASAYLREGKHKLAVQLYQEVLFALNEQCQTPSSNRDMTPIISALKNLGKTSLLSSDFDEVTGTFQEHFAVGKVFTNKQTPSIHVQPNTLRVHRKRSKERCTLFVKSESPMKPTVTLCAALKHLLLKSMASCDVVVHFKNYGKASDAARKNLYRNSVARPRTFRRFIRCNFKNKTLPSNVLHPFPF